MSLIFLGYIILSNCISLIIKYAILFDKVGLSVGIHLFGYRLKFLKKMKFSLCNIGFRYLNYLSQFKKNVIKEPKVVFIKGRGGNVSDKAS